MFNLLVAARKVEDALEAANVTTVTKDAEGAAESYRSADVYADTLFDLYRTSGDGTNRITERQSRSLEALFYTAHRRVNEATVNTEALRWAAKHPNVLVAMADALDERHAYENRLLDEINRLRGAYAAQVAEEERAEAERKELEAKLPDIVTELQQRIAELESEKGR